MFKPTRALALAIVALSVTAPTAAAQGGGAAAPGPAQIEAVTCYAGQAGTCGGRAAVRGQALAIRGSNLDAVSRVVFAGRRGRRDDAKATVSDRGADYVVATVPTKAKTGPLVALSARGTRLAHLRKVRVASGPPMASGASDHVFPIRGPHNFGYTATNNFGGGGQRKHLGQDLFAKCGTALVAALGGTVQFSGYHSAAGNYVVIDGANTDIDYVYMHLRQPSPLRTDDAVATGEKIGEVGETGRATGCHLHFEMWSGPGWYEGGSAFDPLPSLKQWDSYS